MAPPRRHVTQATVVAPLLQKGKTIEAPDPEDRRPNLSDIHISNAEDSHSNVASPRGMQVAEPKPQLNSEQLLQMLSKEYGEPTNRDDLTPRGGRS